jgi:hypothetical protein
MRRKVLVWVRDAHASHDQSTMRDMETRHDEVVNARSGCTDEMRAGFRYDAWEWLSNTEGLDSFWCADWQPGRGL